MWPLMAKLADEARNRTDSWELRGVRTVIMYPMNALVSDQVSRLRRLIGDPDHRFVKIFREICGNGVRRPQFGMYTGRTPYAGPEPRKDADHRLENTYSKMVHPETDEGEDFLHQLTKEGKIPSKENFDAFLEKLHNSKHIPDAEDAELVTRFEMQQFCPDILITNYSMLEYMLLRPREKKIWDDTKRWLESDPKNKLLFVIDEAHMYRGSAGGEVSDVKKVVSPVLVNNEKTTIYHIDFSFDNLKLGGSAFAQTLGKVGDEVPSVQDAEYFRDAFLAVQELVNKGLILAGHDISAGGLITTLLEMCFANVEGGMEINLDKIKEQDLIKILFAENPGIVIQVSDKHKEAVKQILEDAGVGYVKLGKPTDERHILVSKGDATYQFGIDYMRDVWYSTSYLLDRKQSMNGCAKKRFENYKMQPVEFAFMPDFKGKFSQYGINPDRRTPSGIRAAIIREKGTNGEREMAYSLYLAGFDVKDVTMTDLISGRETLEDVNMIVYCGGFSNSDVLGSAKGWAGAFLFNPKAKEALDKYYAREDTLSLGVCNGCQLMMELNLINPEHKKNGKMLHNDSHKFESRFLGVTVPTNRSVMLGSLSGSKLGIWVAHGEGKFSLPYDEDKYNVVLKYSYDEYPSNPNGSDYSIAGLASADGRHLAMMPHLERAIFPWQNGCYPADRVNSDQITPWVEAFVNARKWVEANKK